jgi:hypothetical protein
MPMRQERPGGGPIPRGRKGGGGILPGGRTLKKGDPVLEHVSGVRFSLRCTGYKDQSGAANITECTLYKARYFHASRTAASSEKVAISCKICRLNCI